MVYNRLYLRRFFTSFRKLHWELPACQHEWFLQHFVQSLLRYCVTWLSVLKTTNSVNEKRFSPFRFSYLPKVLYLTLFFLLKSYWIYLLETVFSSIFYLLSECISNFLFQKEEVVLKKTSLNKHCIIEVSLFSQSFARNSTF